MKLPADTTYLFVCAQHNMRLGGEPTLVHPNLHATAVYVFDTSGMYCLEGNNDEADAENNCQSTWEVRA